MPTYDYVCSSCGHEFEAFQSMKDDPLNECPQCHGQVKRKVGGGTGVIFKGSGFYINDSKKKSSTDSKPDNKPEPAASAS